MFDEIIYDFVNYEYKIIQAIKIHRLENELLQNNNDMISKTLQDNLI